MIPELNIVSVTSTFEVIVIDQSHVSIHFVEDSQRLKERYKSLLPDLLLEYLSANSSDYSPAISSEW